MTTFDVEAQGIKNLDDQMMNLWDTCINMLSDEDKKEAVKQREEIIEKRKQQNDFIKKCHPDNNNHWPPNELCPVCRKIIYKIEKEAISILGEEVAKDEDKLQEKMMELFEKKYMKKKE